MTIGQRIRSIRSDLALSQAELSRRSKVAVAHLCRIEKGQEPRMSTLRRIAKGLKVPAHELLDD